MDWVIDHKLLKEDDGYRLILYLDKGLTEFSNEFTDGNYKQNIKEQIKKYITKNFPNLKIKGINIMVGSILIASLPFSSSVVKAQSTVSGSYNSREGIYTVESGDTLYKIANHFNTTVYKLKDVNKLSNDLIYVGQRLQIPRDNSYIVRKGDALYKIAYKYNITIKQLKLYNKLNNDIIYIGQKIYIPQNNTINTIEQLPHGIYNINSNGEHVKRIQNALNVLGYSLNEDGDYNEKTKTVILDFQTQYDGLINDGIYGPRTMEYLKRAILTDHIIVDNPSDIKVLINKDNSLPSNYKPENLVVPNIDFTFKEFHEKKLMRKDAATALENLFRAGKKENINLYGLSGYRSYDRQKYIFTSKVMREGMKKANEFSAKPGESEHQTGLAMDVTSNSVGYGLSQYFGETREGKWLRKNAHKHGFIIRYPEGKEDITGYKYEPWHIRYIGKEVSTEIKDNNITLEEYFYKNY